MSKIKGLCESCDKEALRLVKQMPKWIPATQEGVPVKMKMIIPIKFGDFYKFSNTN